MNKTTMTLKGAIGTELGVSPWLLVGQDRVNAFADVTLDPDWMHIDPVAAAAGPAGGTIVQGFLTLSLLIHFNHQLDIFAPEKIDYAFNYGLNRVRWLAPLPAGKRIRNRASLAAVTDRPEGTLLIATLNTVEVEGSPKPAMIAEWLSLVKYKVANAPDGLGEMS